MSDTTQAHSLEPFDREVIRRKRRELVRHGRILPQDGDDLEQELALWLLKKLPYFNPQRGLRRTFAVTVVQQGVDRLLRDQRARKRDHRRIQSLNKKIRSPTGGPIELAGTIGEREHNARRQRHSHSPAEQVELALDVATLLDRLPHRLRDFALRLGRQSLTEISRELRIPRSTLCDWLRRLRAYFEREYFSDSN